MSDDKKDTNTQEANSGGRFHDDKKLPQKNALSRQEQGIVRAEVNGQDEKQAGITDGAKRLGPDEREIVFLRNVSNSITGFEGEPNSEDAHNRMYLIYNTNEEALFLIKITEDALNCLLPLKKRKIEIVIFDDTKKIVVKFEGNTLGWFNHLVQLTDPEFGTITTRNVCSRIYKIESTEKNVSCQIEKVGTFFLATKKWIVWSILEKSAGRIGSMELDIVPPDGEKTDDSVYKISMAKGVSVQSKLLIYTAAVLVDNF